MKRYIIPGLAAVAVVAGTVAYAQTDGQPGHRGHRMFEKLDANKNGAVTRAEVTAAVEKHFTEVDTNKDGTISAAELDAMHQRMHDMMFERMDTDKNGQISRDEFRAAHADMGKRWGKGHHGGRMGGGMMKENATRADMLTRAQAMFDRVDTNRDGTITAAERDAAHGRMKDMRGHGQHGSPQQ